MDTLQQAPALWYWSEPAYSKSRLKVLATVGGHFNFPLR